MTPAAVSVARAEGYLRDLRTSLVDEAPESRRDDVRLLVDEALRHLAPAVRAAQPIARVRVEGV